MKICCYCGGENAGDSVLCSGCGTEFVNTPEEVLPHSTAARTAVLNSFSTETAAFLAAEHLRVAGIGAFIASDDCGGFLPPLQLGKEFRLMVADEDLTRANEVLSEASQPLTALGEQQGEIVSPQKAEASNQLPAISMAACIGAFVLGIVVGAVVLSGYQAREQQFTGTVERASHTRGRVDTWEVYQKGFLVSVANDRNLDGKRDRWYYYESGRLVREEEDDNFDGQVDAWFTYSNETLAEARIDTDYDGKPDVTEFFRFGVINESHWILPDSGLLWKKDFYTNGVLLEEFIDLDRDGKFDEKVTYNALSLPVKREKLH